jgi:hypothetical protein
MALKDVMDADITNVFLNNDDIAEAFTFSRTASSVNAIFENAFAVIIGDVETSRPAISVKDSDIIGITHNDIFTRVLDGIAYNVIGIQPDGNGMTLVVLSQD